MSKLNVDFISNRNNDGPPLVTDGLLINNGLQITDNVNVSGILTATGGIDAIGIQSGGINVTTGVITAFNFVGRGNTFAYDSISKIVDISLGAKAQVAVATVAPTPSLQGDLWYNSDLARTYVYYNDGDSAQWVDASPYEIQFTRIIKNQFTATEGQSLFVLSEGYATGYVDVYLNGVKLPSADYVESTSDSISLVSEATSGDIVEVVNYKVFNAIDVNPIILKESLTASGITTTLNLSKQDHKVTVSGITTIGVTGGVEGESHTLRIVNSGIATVGFTTDFLWPSGSVPVLPTASGAISIISFTVHRVGAAGTQLLAGASLNYS